MKVYIFDQYCIRSGEICVNPYQYNDCIEYDETSVESAKYWLAHNEVKNSNDLFMQKVCRNIILFFENDIRNIRLAGKK
jgi:hypothetical protein